MSYLIAKIDGKWETLSLKYEIILYQKEKRNKIFQVKKVSKDVRKTIFPSLMFLFNLSKSFIISPLNQWNNKYTWFSRKIFVIYRKWRLWIFFNQTRLVFFLHVSNVLGVCRGVRVRSHASYAEAWIFGFEFVYFNIINTYITVYPTVMQTWIKFIFLLSKIDTSHLFQPLRRIKISFFLLSICTVELISAPNYYVFRTMVAITRSFLGTVLTMG